MVSRSFLAVGLILAMAMTPLLTAGVRAQQAPAPPMQPPGAATPIVGTDTNAQLTEFLSLAPDILTNALSDAQGGADVLQFGDARAQLAAVGIATPTSTEGEAFSAWNRAIRGISLPDVVLTWGLHPEFADAFGFDILQVDAGMTVGTPPSTITFLHGRFDQDRLRSAWQKSGYHEVEVGSTTVFSLSAEPTVDFASPVGRMATARFNNAMILSNGIVVFTPSLDLMQRVLGVANGAEPSLAQNPELSALVTSLSDPLASAIVLRGSGLRLNMMFGRGSADAINTIKSDIQATGTIGEIKLALFGVTPGGPLTPGAGGGTPIAAGPNAIFAIHLLMTDSQTAEAATKVVPKRLETLASVRTRQPYTDLVTLKDIAVAPGAPVVVIALDFAPGYVPAIWGTMVFSNDLLFLAWGS